ncbi:MAG: hypothetical protein ACT4PT_09625 [Methanobacteriota archaeon]
MLVPFAWLGIAVARKGGAHYTVIALDFVLTYTAYFFALLLFALRFGRASGKDRAQLALVSGALALHPLVSVGGSLGSGSSLVRASTMASLAVAAILVALWLANTRSGGRAARTVAILLPAAVLAGMLTRVAAAQYGVEPSNSGVFGLVRLATVAILAYAILRHQLLGLDVKVKWTLKQSTVAAAFVGVFFVVSESASTFFAGSVGPYLGIAAAGLLVFAIAPLQHLAQRVADKAMPGVKSVAEMDPVERARVYREACARAWADGSVSREERGMLQQLRASLNLDGETALRIEEDVAGGGARS